MDTHTLTDKTPGEAVALNARRLVQTNVAPYLLLRGLLDNLAARVTRPNHIDHGLPVLRGVTSSRAQNIELICAISTARKDQCRGERAEGSVQSKAALRVAANGNTGQRAEQF